MNSILEYKKYFVRATENAAIACAQLRGCNDKNKADQAAVNGMRVTLKDSPVDVRVAIGEGEIDEAPMLYIGEKLGTKIKDDKILSLDIAVDPLECTKNCANRFSARFRLTSQNFKNLSSGPKSIIFYALSARIIKISEK